MIKELKDKGFALVTRAHNAHLSTGSFAEHMALGEFYEALDGKIDEIVETWQGCFTERLDKPDSGISEAIRELANWLAENKEEIAKDNEIIENQLDELGAIFAKAHYKLEFLK
jgi:hypothetical protein